MTLFWVSLVAQRVKNLPSMQETWVQSPGWEDPLEKEMATQSSILVWRIPWIEEPGRGLAGGGGAVGYSSCRSQRVSEQLTLSVTLISFHL